MIRYALFSVALLQTRPAAEPEVGIDVTRVTYLCVGGEVASASVSMDVELLNRGAAALSVPSRAVEFGSQRFALTAADLGAGRFAAYLSGIFTARASIGTPNPPVPDDFRQLQPGQSHIIKAEQSIVINATDVRVTGALDQMEYVAQFQVGSGVPWTTDAAAWERLQREVAPLWQTHVWSKLFRIVVPPVPKGLPGC